MKRVIIESPYKAKHPAELEYNLAYARACMADSLKRGEAPLASHLLYTQPGILNDDIPEERQLGIAAGFVWNRQAQLVAVYRDLGISDGMMEGMHWADKHEIPIQLRTIGWQYYEHFNRL